MGDIDEAIKNQTKLAVKLGGALIRIEAAREAEAFVALITDAVKSSLDKSIEYAPDVISVIVQVVADGLIRSAISNLVKKGDT